MLPKNDEEAWGDKKKESKGKDKKEEPKKEDSKKLDPVSGTWDFVLDSEQIPEEARNVKGTFKLAKDGTVTGRMETPDGGKDIIDGLFDPSTGELSLL